MPTYDYKCVNSGCGKQQEINRAIENRNDLVLCPHCLSECTRVYGAPHIMWFASQTRSPFKK